MGHCCSCLGFGNQNNPHGHRDQFKAEVDSLLPLRYPMLASLVSYCAENGHRIAASNYEPEGSLEDHLYDRLKPLDWKMRMRMMIAAGTAYGLNFLRNETENRLSQFCYIRDQRDRPAVIFTYPQLERITNKFSQDNIIGRGGTGTVYRGRLESEGQPAVAVKLLKIPQGERVASALQHPNLLTHMGYCNKEFDHSYCDKKEADCYRVYNYMPLGSLDDHLHGGQQQPLGWNTRMMIAVGTARGLNFLHNDTNPQVIYIDLTPPNILLDNDFVPKLSDFELASRTDSRRHASRILHNLGYFDPDYCRTARISLKTDVYSFGIVLLELITGKKPFLLRSRHTMPFDWARSRLADLENIGGVADPRLEGRFAEEALIRALDLAARCIDLNPHARPDMRQVLHELQQLHAY